LHVALFEVEPPKAVGVCVQATLRTIRRLDIQAKVCLCTRLTKAVNRKRKTLSYDLRKQEIVALLHSPVFAFVIWSKMLLDSAHLGLHCRLRSFSDDRPNHIAIPDHRETGRWWNGLSTGAEDTKLDRSVAL
jgi:hypothetical protein